MFPFKEGPPRTLHKSTSVASASQMFQAGRKRQNSGPKRRLSSQGTSDNKLSKNAAASVNDESASVQTQPISNTVKWNTVTWDPIGWLILRYPWSVAEISNFFGVLRINLANYSKKKELHSDYSLKLPSTKHLYTDFFTYNF